MAHFILKVFLFIFLIFGTTVFAAIDDEVTLNRAYVKGSMGIGHFFDNNNTTAQNRDATFPNAKYDIAYEGATSYSFAVGNRLENLAYETSFDYIFANLDSVTSDTLSNYTDGDISTHSILINALWYPDLLRWNYMEMYVGAGIGTVYKVDLDQSGCIGARCLANEGFKSAVDEYQVAYQFLLGVESEIFKADSKVFPAGFSIFSEVRDIFFDNIALGRDNHNETFNNIDINVMLWTFGVKFHF